MEEYAAKATSELPPDMPSEVKDFVGFLRAHPKYRDANFLWADISKGHEISKRDFPDAVHFLLGLFQKQGRRQESQRSTLERNSCRNADELFSILDVEMSGGIGLHELIPQSGERWEDAHSSTTSFKIPLKFLQHITVGPFAGSGDASSSVVGFRVLPEFEDSVEWRRLKRALQPDWEPFHGSEQVLVTVNPEHLQMWQECIRNCGMDTRQESIRFYKGSVCDHPQLDGVYMRAEQGLQTWADGRVYRGEWENHTYSGYGALYATSSDEQREDSESRAIYVGNWQDGKRHGHGVFRWEQHLSSSTLLSFGAQAGSSVRKVYEGNFRYDLFRGYGVMRLESASPGLPGTFRQPGLDAGKVLLPNLEPERIVSFEGEWDSDWLETDTQARNSDHTYRHHHPLWRDGRAHRDLRLQEVNLAHLRKKDQKFVRYFGPDGAGVQSSGDPMPDLAVAFYQKKGGDALHMK